jgi:hypothetical protein
MPYFAPKNPSWPRFQHLRPACRLISLADLTRPDPQQFPARHRTCDLACRANLLRGLQRPQTTAAKRFRSAVHGNPLKQQMRPFHLISLYARACSAVRPLPRTPHRVAMHHSTRADSQSRIQPRDASIGAVLATLCHFFHLPRVLFHTITKSVAHARRQDCARIRDVRAPLRTAADVGVCAKWVPHGSLHSCWRTAIV